MLWHKRRFIIYTSLPVLCFTECVFTLRYYNLSELSQALKQTLQVGSELVILLAPRLSCMAHMAARNNLNGPPPIKKQITTSACIKRSRQEWKMGIFFLIGTANNGIHPQLGYWLFSCTIYITGEFWDELRRIQTLVVGREEDLQKIALFLFFIERPRTKMVSNLLEGRFPPTGEAEKWSHLKEG